MILNTAQLQTLKTWLVANASSMNDSVTASVPSVVHTGCQIGNTADVIRDVRASFIQY